MSNRQSVSPFAFVFWALVVVLILALFGIGALVVYAGGLGTEGFIIIALAYLLMGVFLVLIPTLVYRDASKRGMDPWLWATVATFVPNLIGVVVYLIVRTQVRRTCISCGKGLQGDFKICPYCGERQELLCPQCSEPVAADWKVCPLCEHALN
jgi:RNA polymerase subunit RPABC4/transcription elongation factor Spt4